MAIKDFKTIKPGQLGRKRADEIRKFVIALLSTEEFREISGKAEAQFLVTRQAIHKQLQRLEENGIIEGRGRTQGREYRLATKSFVEKRDVAGLAEYELWEEFALPHMEGVNESVVSILRYGFTEMVNNVIDHSESKDVRVELQRNPTMIKLTISDHGVGIFHKIQQALNLPSAQEAIFELQKGKLTTDPERHTGEGIFYTSRMVDYFQLLSRGLYLSHRREGNDWLLGEDDANKAGTWVFMTIDPNSTHTMEEVYEHYSVPRQDMNFNRTNVILSLLQSGENTLVSRSQAKRVLARLPRFKEVMLDFEGVNNIGPAFADEIFRVFANAHGDVSLQPINMTDDVSRMVERARSARETQSTDAQADVESDR